MIRAHWRCPPLGPQCLPPPRSRAQAAPRRAAAPMGAQRSGDAHSPLLCGWKNEDLGFFAPVFLALCSWQGTVENLPPAPGPPASKRAPHRAPAPPNRGGVAFVGPTPTPTPAPAPAPSRGPSSGRGPVGERRPGLGRAGSGAGPGLRRRWSRLGNGSGDGDGGGGGRQQPGPGQRPSARYAPGARCPWPAGSSPRSSPRWRRRPPPAPPSPATSRWPRTGSTARPPSPGSAGCPSARRTRPGWRRRTVQVGLGES